MTLPYLRESATFDRATIADIQRAARTGVYDIRGFGAKRTLPHFDDLLFLGASVSRYPLEGYRERCDTDVVLGDRFARNPLHLAIPVTIAGMSFGALSAQAKEALGRGASEVGTSTTTGDGGMTPEERGQSKYLVYQYLPSRYGMNPADLRKADAIEMVIGQGAKPGGGGMLLGQKISERVAGMRTLPDRHRPAVGVPASRLDRPRRPERSRSRSCARSPTGRSPSTSRWARPARTTTSKLAVAAGADVVVVDGMQGGTAATQDVFIEHVGIPTLAAIPQRRPGAARPRPAPQGPAHRLRRHPHRRGRRQGAGARRGRGLDRHRGAHRPRRPATRPRPTEYASDRLRRRVLRRLPGRPRPGRDHHPGPRPGARLDPVEGGQRIANYLRVLTMEAQAIARACGKAHVRHLEPEDLVALTIEAAAMARVPLAGTDWIPGAAR